MNKIKTMMMAAVAICAASMTSCTDKMDWEVDPAYDRLFGITSISTTPDATSIAIEFKAPAGADVYEIQWSTDSLTDDSDEPAGVQSMKVEKSPATIEGLAGDTYYFLRVRALSNSKTCSKWAYPIASSGKRSVHTLKEQIMNTVLEEDRSQDAIRVTWKPGMEVTHLIVTDSEGNETRVDIDADAKAAGEMTVTGLNPLTAYTFSIYNGEAMRGTCSASTTAAAPKGDYTYNMPQTMTVLDNETMKEIAAAAKEKAADPTNYSATIVIPAGVTIDLVGKSESGDPAALKIPEGMSVTFFGAAGVKPVVKLSKSINLAGSHSFVRFQDLAITDGGCQYLINQSEACSIAELSFSGCEFYNLDRSIVRTQGSNAQSYDVISFDNCVATNVSSGNGYSMVLIGQDKSICGKLILRNSTFDTVQRSFIETSKSDIAGGILIENCTIYNAVFSGRYLIDANGRNTNITINNTILGKTFDAEASRGVRTAGTIDVNNNLRASDCVYGSNDIKEIERSEMSSADIFTAPDDHNFTLKISDKIGDPRWYKQGE